MEAGMEPDKAVDEIFNSLWENHNKNEWDKTSDTFVINGVVFFKRCIKLKSADSFQIAQVKNSETNHIQHTGKLN